MSLSLSWVCALSLVGCSEELAGEAAQEQKWLASGGAIVHLRAMPGPGSQVASTPTSPGAQPAPTGSLAVLCTERIRLKRVAGTGPMPSPSPSPSPGQGPMPSPSPSPSLGDDSWARSSSSSDSDDRFEDSVVIYRGEMRITRAGTSLGRLRVPAGRYHRLEIDLEPGCSSGASAVVSNAAGQFRLSRSARIRFEGNFDLQGEVDLDLMTSDLVSIFEQHNGQADLRDVLKNHRGWIR